MRHADILARRYCKQRGLVGANFDTVQASAYAGLVDAAYRWDELSGVKFTTYLRHRVIGHIVEDFRSRSPGNAWRQKFASLDQLTANREDSDFRHSFDCIGKNDSRLKDIDRRNEADKHLRQFDRRERLAYRLYHAEGWDMLRIGKLLGISQSMVSIIIGKMQERLEATCS